MLQTEAVQRHDPPSTSEAEEPPNIQTSSLRARWLPKVVALATATVAFGAVLVPRALGVLSLLVSAIGLLGLFSPKTPFARRLTPVLGEKVVAAFFRHLSVGMKGWAVGLAVVTASIICTYLDFIRSLGFVLATVYTAAFISLLPLSSKERKTLGRFAAAPAALLLLTGIILSFGALCKYQITRGSFDDMYATVSRRGALGDRMMLQAPTMAAYADLYRRNYAHAATASRFAVALTQYHEDYDLAVTVSWRTERGTYIIGKDTLDRLRDVGIDQSALNRLAPLQGRSFTGASAFERALRERLGDADLARTLEQLFEFSCRSRQKAREVEMKRAWQEYCQALQDPRVISDTEAQVRATAEAAASSHKVYVFPYFLDPQYAISTLFFVGADQFSALAAILKISIAWLTWRLLYYGSSVVKATLLVASLSICWMIAKWAKAYNAKYEQPDTVSDGSTSMFFAALACLSLVLGFLTL